MARRRIRPRVAVVVPLAAATAVLWAAGAHAAVAPTVGGPALAERAVRSSDRGVAASAPPLDHGGAVRIAVSIAPTPTPSGTVDPTPSGTVDPTPSGTPGPTLTGTAGPTASPSATGSPTGTASPDPVPAPGGGLPRTGVAIGSLVLAGGALVGAGAALRTMARRRELPSG